jgi:DinB superfamily
MDLRQWLVDELDDAATRVRAQVLERVPVERRFERPGGGNSIVWATFHTARHADLAMSALSGSDLVLARWGDNVTPAGKGGGGVEEAEQAWSEELEPALVDQYLAAVCEEGRRLLGSMAPADLEHVPDAPSALRRAGVDASTFDWLYAMWDGKPAAFLVRWPMIGHLANHTGEMIATRNRMGLSPF